VDVKRQAAEGDAYSQRMLAQSYRYGAGSPRDAQLALMWDLKAAEAGNVDSQYDVGMHYLRGLGVEANYPSAFGWLKKAADKKHPAALFELGQMTIAGQATFPDDVQGLRMIRESALLGYAPARQLLEERHGIRLD
jgi:TPR repeat protein